MVSNAKKHEKFSALITKNYAHEHAEKIYHWSPPVPPVKTRKKTLNTKLKIAVLVSERLYNGFRFEAELLLLTPENWKSTLENIDFDFLLVESCTKTVTGHWEYAQYISSEKLATLVGYAKEKKIPTVFWNTQDHAYHTYYKEIVSMFDFVYCADPLELEILHKEDIAAEILLPAVQPAIFNPFCTYNDVSAFSIDVLFDGWADLLRLSDKLKIIQDVKKYGLKIIESKKEIFSNKVSYLPELQDELLGCVTSSGRQIALKYSKVVLSFQDTLTSRTSQQWDALEVAASRVVMLFQGQLGDDDIRKSFIIENNSDNNLLLMLVSFDKDDLYRERLAHKAWREVNQKHTFNHRLNTICEKLKIQKRKPVMASIIMPTYRISRLDDCLNTFEKQSYVNKELIIIYNGNEQIPYEVNEHCTNNEHIKLVTMPQEQGVGACMNMGHQVAKGKYCFRMDDDDYYGSNYILDMMLYLNSGDFDVFGQPPGYCCFEKEGELYQRNIIEPLTIIPSDDVLKNNAYIGGNTIGGNRKFLLKHKYPEKNFGSADTAFLLNSAKHLDEVLIMSSMNMVISRREDLSSHTWQLPEEKIKSTAKYIHGLSVNDIFI